MRPITMAIQPPYNKPQQGKYTASTYSNLHRNTSTFSTLACLPFTFGGRGYCWCCLGILLSPRQYRQHHRPSVTRLFVHLCNNVINH